MGYLEQLSERLPYSIAVEFRGGGWMDEDRRKSTLEILVRHGLSYVVADEPQGFKSSVPQAIACTAPLAVVRFTVEMQPIGRGASVAERFKYLYSENEPKAWVKPIHTLAQQAQQVHALMNNCYADYACGTPDN